MAAFRSLLTSFATVHPAVPQCRDIKTSNILLDFHFNAKVSQQHPMPRSRPLCGFLTTAALPSLTLLVFVLQCFCALCKWIGSSVSLTPCTCAFSSPCMRT